MDGENSVRACADCSLAPLFPAVHSVSLPSNPDPGQIINVKIATHVTLSRYLFIGKAKLKIHESPLEKNVRQSEYAGFE
ncbi:hypothetical protein SAMN05421755_10367 [Nitrosomonas sp. Nm33]|nr:hypothetical protein SAMN05421755_10367 [Nitrosomonas sp. Nm33]